MTAKKTKLVYFGASIGLYEAMLDEMGEKLEELGVTGMRGNNGKISHSAVITEAIKMASNLLKLEEEKETGE